MGGGWGDEGEGSDSLGGYSEDPGFVFECACLLVDEVGCLQDVGGAGCDGFTVDFEPELCGEMEEAKWFVRGGRLVGVGCLDCLGRLSWRVCVGALRGSEGFAYGGVFASW